MARPKKVVIPDPEDVLPDPAPLIEDAGAARKPIMSDGKPVYHPTAERKRRMYRVAELRMKGTRTRDIAIEEKISPAQVHNDMRDGVTLGYFEGNWPRIEDNRGGRPASHIARVEVPGEGVLKALRHVLANKRGTDRGTLEKVCRTWHDQSPQKFVEKLHQYESEERALNAGKKESESLADPGSERTLRLIDRLLEDANAAVAG